MIAPLILRRLPFPVYRLTSILGPKWAVLGLLALLNGCAVFTDPGSPSEPAPTDQQLWPDLAGRLEALQTWELIGKIGIRTPEDSVTAAIHQWTQVDNFFNIKLSSTFFGLGATTITGNEQQVVLSESGEEPRTSNRPNQLIHEALGIPLPLTLLPYWIKGLPVPDTPYDIDFNALGIPSSLTQLGWRLEFDRHHWHAGLPLPGKIRLRQGETTITLAIKQWTLI